MNYVYHGSQIQNLKELVPHKSTHGTYCYATSNRSIAIIMSHVCGDDATYTLRGDGCGHYDLIERIPFAFNKMFKGKFSLYLLDSSYFKDIKTGFNEVVSDRNVPVIKEEKYDNLFDEINKLDNVTLYYYPNRPNYIPFDDSDLINTIRNVYIKKLGHKYTIYEIARWIFLHPNLENEFRLIAAELGIEVPDYELIKEKFILLQSLKHKE